MQRHCFTNILLDFEAYKSSNALLGVFSNTIKKRTIEVWLGENKIDKLFFHDIRVDLVNQTSEDLFKYLSDQINFISQAELVVEYYLYQRHFTCPIDVHNAFLFFDDYIFLKIPQEHLLKIEESFDKEILSIYDYGQTYDETYNKLRLQRALTVKSLVRESCSRELYS